MRQLISLSSVPRCVSFLLSDTVQHRSIGNFWHSDAVWEGADDPIKSRSTEFSDKRCHFLPPEASLRPAR